MTEAEQRALLTVALLAAHADGLRDTNERAAITELTKRLARSRTQLVI
jgi:tellurite resistance protein